LCGYVFLTIGFVCLIAGISLFAYLMTRRFGWIKPTYDEKKLQRKVTVYMVQPLATMAAGWIALGGMLLSLEKSDQSLQQAREMAYIHSRPFLSIQNAVFQLTRKALPHEPEDTFTLILPMANAGGIPATKISTSLDLTFVSAQESHHRVRLTTNLEKALDVLLTRSNHSLAVSPKQSRAWVLTLPIHKIDGESIWKGETPVTLRATLRYSSPDIDRVWTYEMEANIQSKRIDIVNERVT